MRGQLRIDTMYAFVVVDTDGTEGIPAYPQGEILVPLTGADISRVAQLMPIAMGLAAQGNKSIELVHFTERRHVDWIDPPDGPQRPETPSEPQDLSPAAAALIEAFKAHQRPAKADQVIVAALIEQNGTPTVVLGFEVEGEMLPGLGISRKLAQDMYDLLDQALKAFAQLN